MIKTEVKEEHQLLYVEGNDEKLSLGQKEN